MAGLLYIAAVFVTLLTLCTCSWIERPYLKKKEIPICGQPCQPSNIHLGAPGRLSPFYDLTRQELQAIRTFFKEKFKAVNSFQAKMSSSFILTADLYLANKSVILKNDYTAPRQARVILFRGDLATPVVEEFVCNELLGNMHCKRFGKGSVPFSFRPFTEIEFREIKDKFAEEIDKKLHALMKKSYDVNSFFHFRVIPTPLPSAFTRMSSERLVWLMCYYNVPHAALHPVDLGILVDTFSPKPSQWKIKYVLYAGEIFETLDLLKDLYENNKIDKIQLNLPMERNERLFSTLNKRDSSTSQLRPPLQVEPDGKRYSIQDRKVSYLEWTFFFRMSSITGPALYDLRFKGEKIAFEISLSEIAVYYFGKGPSMTSHSLFSSTLLGLAAKTIIPGADCPEYATVINQTFFNPLAEEPLEVDGAFCLFESNSGYPLRRHASYDRDSGSFYGGMLDSFLTLRTILVLGSSDYVIDFILHQDGSFESKVTETGYIQVDAARRGESYGYKLNEKIMGPLHQSLFHFKVDLDINGETNTFQTVDIGLESANLPHNPCKTTLQPSFKHVQRNSENASTYSFNPEKPQYLIVSGRGNNQNKQDPRGYRIKLDGMYQSLLPKGLFTEPSISWARHQLVATKHKDTERSSSSIYSTFDSSEPVMRFSDFYADDESLENTDIVLWITGSMYDIPRSEDLPVSSTVGKSLSFFLLPFNYFPECPSMRSVDSLFIRVYNESLPTKAPFLERYHNDAEQCITPCPTLDALLFDKPNFAIDTRPN